MARFKYVINPLSGGWQVTCNGVSGPPYASRNEAVLDTLAAVASLIGNGSQAEVRLIEMDGTGRLLEPRDAKLFQD